MSIIQSKLFGIFSIDLSKSGDVDRQKKLGEFKSYPTEALLAMSLSKGELSKVIGLEEDGTFDYALPQNWLDSFVEAHCPKKEDRNDYYNLVRSTTFSVYLDRGLFFCSGCMEVQDLINADQVIPQIGIIHTDYRVVFKVKEEE